MFQSPIGTQKTCVVVELILNSMSVSIPYRYTKNETIDIKEQKNKEKFQSPIGTQKTLKLKPIFILDESVSIPYRYTKNGSAWRDLAQLDLRFNPL